MNAVNTVIVSIWSVVFLALAMFMYKLFATPLLLSGSPNWFAFYDPFFYQELSNELTTENLFAVLTGSALEYGERINIAQPAIILSVLGHSTILYMIVNASVFIWVVWECCKKINLNVPIFTLFLTVNLSNAAYVALPGKEALQMRQ